MMGARSWYPLSRRWMCWLFLLCGVLVVVECQQGGTSLCDLPGCNCTDRVQWKTVNCTFDDEQDVYVTAENVPRTLYEVFMSGGRDLIFAPHAFDALAALAAFELRESRRVTIETATFNNITSPSLLVLIQDCDQLIIKTGAFDSAVNTVTVEVSRIDQVWISRAAFTKLDKGTFEDIGNLTLSSGAFEVKHQKILMRHGPVAKLLFNNTIIATLPTATFPSPLAEVRIQNSIVGEVQEGAFKAYQLTAVSLVNSTVGVIASGAFTTAIFVTELNISLCKVDRIETDAIGGAVGTLIIEHSSIKEFQSSAVNGIIATTQIVGNQIYTFGSSALQLNNWNKIVIDQNVIENLKSDFLQGSPTPFNTPEVFFKGNDIQCLEPGALSFISKLQVGTLTLDNNFFNETCQCSTEEWMRELTNDTRHTGHLLDTSYCIVNELLERCFELTQGLINVRNFTQLVCNLSDKVECEHYNGETKIVNTTSKVFSEKDDDRTPKYILVLTLSGLVVITVIAIFIMLLLKGGQWLKRTGYLRNMQYNHNERSTDEENTIVTIDESEQALEMPEELTLDFLQQLRKRLDDPNTKEEATEMIERLYEIFIVEDSYENNNRQEEETHLYEELGNLQQQLKQLEEEPEKLQNYDGPMSILRLMEERFNLQIDDHENARPALAGEYSEPSDAAVHLYTELQQNRDSIESENGDTLRSNNSGNMAMRPLPEKPKDLPSPSSSKS